MSFFYNIDILFNNNIIINFINIFGIIFILFMTLVFNEVFEFNCFGLEKYTKKNIAKRANIEEKQLLNIEDDDNSVISNDDFPIRIDKQNQKENIENDINIINKNLKKDKI